MEHKKILTFGAIAVALVAIIGLSAFTFAAEPQAQSQNGIDKPTCPFGGGGKFQENMEAVKQALDNQDYQAWLLAVGAESEIGQAVSADEFPRLIQAHQLMQEGQSKFEEARKIKEELGLPDRPGKMGKLNKFKNRITTDSDVEN